MSIPLQPSIAFVAPKPMRHLENSLAIFITTNERTINTTTSYFQKHFHDEGHRNIVPLLCMTDGIFATQLKPKTANAVTAPADPAQI